MTTPETAIENPYVSGEILDMMTRMANDLYREESPASAYGAPARADAMTGSPSAPGAMAESAYYFMIGGKAVPAPPAYSPGLDVHGIRGDFPILSRRVNGKPLIWLDNAATTQKPACVIAALDRYYREYNSNIHRGAHTLAQVATRAYEDARTKARDFIGAASAEEIVFVRGATEAINLVAESYGGMTVGKGDEIVITMMEHHSNILPWQRLAARGALIKAAPINDRGEVILGEYEKLLSPRTRMVAVTHVSNVLGTVNPVAAMIEMAHRYDARVLVDGAQSAPHLPVDVRALDADFYVFSGHKVYGPTGIGVLYGKRTLLEEMPPWQRGGGMIKEVTVHDAVFDKVPQRFEAGTGNIADAVGLGAALDYVKRIGMGSIEKHERELTAYAMERLYQIPGLRIIGTAQEKTSVISFVLNGISPERAAQYLDQEGIATRAGHHCAMPALRRYGLASTVRASLGLYNTMEEVDSLANALRAISR